jgi:hypothetical protein
MDIYVQIKNKKGEVFKVVNFGREEYLSSFKERLAKSSETGDGDFPVFYGEFKAGNYLDVKKVKKLKEEVKAIAATVGKDMENYKEIIQKRTKLENEIINRSSLKSLMAIGMQRLEELLEQGEEKPEAGTKPETEIDRDEIMAELDSMRKEISKLSESEHLLEAERKTFQDVFDIELLFDILSESAKSSSGIYVKN